MRNEEWMEYLMPEEADLLETETILKGEVPNRVQHFPRRKLPVLLAACLLMAALGIAALASGVPAGSRLSEWFQAAGQTEGRLLGELTLEAGAGASDAGYTIRIAEAASDGANVYVVLEVTAPESVVLDAEKISYGLTFFPQVVIDKKSGKTTATALTGGGSLEVMEQTAPNCIEMLFSYCSSKSLDGRKLLLPIQKITAFQDGKETALAEGSWELELTVPKSSAYTVRQWTKVELEDGTYIVTKVKLSAMGAQVTAFKCLSLSDLWNTFTELVRGACLAKHPLSLPPGWQKEAFFAAPLAVQKKDGTAVEYWSDNSGSRGFACRRAVQYSRLVAPEEIRELRLGNQVLKCR